MGRMQRTKGANAERAGVRWLNTRGHRTRRFLAGDGEQPGDIDGVPGLCIEVKDQATYKFPQWLKQVRAEARPGDLPVVLIKPNGIGLDSTDKWWILVRADDFMTEWETNHGT